jgi:hypothetical protein
MRIPTRPGSEFMRGIGSPSSVSSLVSEVGGRA